MFVTQNQIYFFIESLFIGVISGVGFEVIFAVKQVVSNEKIKNLTDCLFAFILFPTYFIFSQIFAFPNFRFYMLVGVILGFVIYCINFHKTVAKLVEKVYNKTISFMRSKKRDRRKENKRP